MVASPAFTAVTVPSSTVATLALLLCQVTFLLVASSGCTVAVRVALPPVNSSRVALSSETPVTGTGAGFACTVRVAAWLMTLTPLALVTTQRYWKPLILVVVVPVV